MSYLKRTRRDADRILPLTSDCLEMLRIHSIERRQKWGEKRKEDRIGDEGSGRGTGKTMNTKGNNEPSNQVFHKTTTAVFDLQFSFYRKRGEVVAKRRVED